MMQKGVARTGRRDSFPDGNNAPIIIGLIHLMPQTRREPDGISLDYNSLKEIEMAKGTTVTQLFVSFAFS